MRKIILPLFVLFFAVHVFAQQVNTVAGLPLVTGSVDGDRSTATFNNPHGIAVDSLGNIYTCDRWSHIVRKVTPEGVVSTIAGSPGLTGSTDGIGKLATIKLAKDGHEIYLHGRNAQKLDTVISEIKAQTNNPHIKGFVADFSDLDLLSFAFEAFIRFSLFFLRPS